MLIKKRCNDLATFLNHFPMTEAQAFDLSKVHRRTWQRWKDGECNPPEAIIDLLILHATGSPPDKVWKGWQFSQGKLYSPMNHRRGFDPIDVIQIPALYADRHRLRDIESHFTLQSKLF